jgi:hypothetical protein
MRGRSTNLSLKAICLLRTEVKCSRQRHPSTRYQRNADGRHHETAQELLERHIGLMTGSFSRRGALGPVPSRQSVLRFCVNNNNAEITACCNQTHFRKVCSASEGRRIQSVWRLGGTYRRISEQFKFCRYRPIEVDVQSAVRRRDPLVVSVRAGCFGRLLQTDSPRMRGPTV